MGDRRVAYNSSTPKNLNPKNYSWKLLPVLASFPEPSAIEGQAETMTLLAGLILTVNFC